MNIIITMAGEGQRFKNIGITPAKHMIMAKGKTLFEWSVESLKNFFDEHFIFITRKSHHAVDFIIEKCALLGINRFQVKEIDGLTKGQAETALLAKELISDPLEEIMIYNIDTYVEPDQLKPEFIKGDGWVPAFDVEGDRWSFVKVDGECRILDITEKVRISRYGTIGLYYFKSFDLLQKIYGAYPFESGKERYIAPLYRAMINANDLSIYSHIIDKNMVYVLGTPEDIKQFDPAFSEGEQ